MTNIAMQTQFASNLFESNGLIQTQNLFDKVQGVFLQLVETLHYLSNNSYDKFSQLLPPPSKFKDILIKGMNLPYWYVFHIVRKGFKPVY